MTAAEKEARVATARWQEQCVRNAEMSDAINWAINILDGMAGHVDLLACNHEARKVLARAIGREP